MIGRPDSAVVAGTLASARRWSLPHEVLDAAALRARYPQFALPADQLAVFEADAGYARAGGDRAGHLELAAEAGAELLVRDRRRAAGAGPDGVHLVAGGAELRAPGW